MRFPSKKVIHWHSPESENDIKFAFPKTYDNNYCMKIIDQIIRPSLRPNETGMFKYAAMVNEYVYTLADSLIDGNIIYANEGHQAVEEFRWLITSGAWRPTPNHIYPTSSSKEVYRYRYARVTNGTSGVYLQNLPWTMEVDQEFLDGHPILSSSFCNATTANIDISVFIKDHKIDLMDLQAAIRYVVLALEAIRYNGFFYRKEDAEAATTHPSIVVSYLNADKISEQVSQTSQPTILAFLESLTQIICLHMLNDIDCATLLKYPLKELPSSIESMKHVVTSVIETSNYNHSLFTRCFSCMKDDHDYSYSSQLLGLVPTTPSMTTHEINVIFRKADETSHQLPVKNVNELFGMRPDNLYPPNSSTTTGIDCAQHNVQELLKYVDELNYEITRVLKYINERDVIFK